VAEPFVGVLDLILFFVIAEGMCAFLVEFFGLLYWLFHVDGCPIDCEDVLVADACFCDVKYVGGWEYLVSLVFELFGVVFIEALRCVIEEYGFT